MLVTLVLTSLLPCLSRAAAFVQGDTAPWSVVCATPGTGDDPAAAPAGTQHLLAHCALCLLQADGLSLGLGPALAPWLAPIALDHAAPVVSLLAPQPPQARSSAQARAPPRTV